MERLNSQLLIDLAAENNLPPNDYFSLWDDLSTWQMDLLKAEGLKRNHRLLDVGCGGLRLGIHAIEYLDDGHYTGIDAFSPYLKFGASLLARLEIPKRANLHLTSDFNFPIDPHGYDFAIAQSVFTHLGKEDSDRCLDLISRVLTPAGRFLFTFLDGSPITRGFLYNGTQPMDRPIGLGAEYFSVAAAMRGLKFRRLAADHPTRQAVAVIEKGGGA